MEPRRPDLSRHAGRFVALRMGSDEVVADAASLDELVALIRSKHIADVSIMRAPRVGEPVHVGFG